MKKLSAIFLLVLMTAFSGCARSNIYSKPKLSENQCAWILPKNRSDIFEFVKVDGMYVDRTMESDHKESSMGDIMLDLVSLPFVLVQDVVLLPVRLVKLPQAMVDDHKGYRVQVEPGQHRLTFGPRKDIFSALGGRYLDLSFETAAGKEYYYEIDSKVSGIDYSYSQTTTYYDVTIKVYDENDVVLAENTAKSSHDPKEFDVKGV